MEYYICISLIVCVAVLIYTLICAVIIAQYIHKTMISLSKYLNLYLSAYLSIHSKCMNISVMDLCEIIQGSTSMPTNYFNIFMCMVCAAFIKHTHACTHAHIQAGKDGSVVCTLFLYTSSPSISDLLKVSGS